MLTVLQNDGLSQSARFTPCARAPLPPRACPQRDRRRFGHSYCAPQRPPPALPAVSHPPSGPAAGVEKPPSCLRSCKTAVSVSPPASRLARVHHFLHGRAHSEIEDGLAILIARPNVRPPRYQQSHSLPVARSEEHTSELQS